MRITQMVLLLLIAVPAAEASDAGYTDPWSAEAEAAAEAAVARLGPHRALALQATVLNIVGAQQASVLNIVGAQQGVVAAVSEVRQAMTALNSEVMLAINFIKARRARRIPPRLIARLTGEPLPETKPGINPATASNNQPRATPDWKIAARSIAKDFSR